MRVPSNVKCNPTDFILIVRSYMLHTYYGYGFVSIQIHGQMNSLPNRLLCAMEILLFHKRKKRSFTLRTYNLFGVVVFTPSHIMVPRKYLPILAAFHSNPTVNDCIIVVFSFVGHLAATERRDRAISISNTKQQRNS